MENTWNNTHYVDGAFMKFPDNGAMLIPNEGKPVYRIRETTVVNIGDDMIGLAFKHFLKDTTDPRLAWPLIAMANPHITNPLDLASHVGETLYIPFYQQWPIARM